MKSENAQRIVNALLIDAENASIKSKAQENHSYMLGWLQGSFKYFLENPRFVIKQLHKKGLLNSDAAGDKTVSS